MSTTQKSVPLFHVSAFSRKTFAGNPAAVVLLESERESTWMQSVAAEMNLSETAFVYPDQAQLRLRWFTPTVEVDLCGHATVATAFVMRELAQQGCLPEYLTPFWKHGCVQFVSRSGVLTAESSTDGITLDFPATCVEQGEIPSGLLEALGIGATDLRFCGRSRFDYLIHVASAEIVRNVKPVMLSLSKLPVRGIIVTSLGDTADHDIISRFFAPAAGVNEDPVTGSAHCALAPYWVPEFGRSTLFGFQASQRGGHVRMELVGDRVRLSGGAVMVSRGELMV
jgi:PhzF family phenazine biosynthesis protein